MAPPLRLTAGILLPAFALKSRLQALAMQRRSCTDADPTAQLARAGGERQAFPPFDRMFSMPPATQLLIVINAVAFLAAMAAGDRLIGMLALWPLGPGFMPWQLVTYAFVHGGLTHLFFNMFGLYMFGSDLERLWGARRYLTYYAVCVLSAAVTQLLFSALAGSHSPTVGASGGVFGLLLAFAMVFPQRIIVPLFPPIPMRAPVFVAVYGALELLFGVTGTLQGVAHFAHLGGLAGGFFLMRWSRRRR